MAGLPDIRLPMFSFLNRGKGLEALEPLKDPDVYHRLREALSAVSDVETLPPFTEKGRKVSRAIRKKRLKNFLEASKIKSGLANRLVSIWDEKPGKYRKMKSIKAVEAKMILKFLEDAGFPKYSVPTIAFAGERDMLFHAFAHQSGSPNEGSIRKGDFHEIYEMYSVDVAPVLAEQGRYNIYCGYLELRSFPNDNVVHARFMQPSGAAPDGTGFEEYSGYFYLQDDTIYVMGFKAEVDDERYVSMEGLAEEPALNQKTTPRGQRRNMAMMVMNGFSRSADGLYDKMVGGQVGRGLTGSTGILSSPCVLYRVTEERLRDLDRRFAEASSYASQDYEDYDEYQDSHYGGRRTSLSSRRNEPFFKHDTVIHPDEKSLFFREKFVGAKSIITGVELRDLGVMADLNIPVPMRSDADDHVDINVFSGR